VSKGQGDNVGRPLIINDVVKEPIVRSLAKSVVPALLIFGFLPSLCLADEPAMVFGPASIRLGIAKDKLVESCPIVSKVDEASARALANKAEESCSLLAFGEDEYLIFAGDQSTSRLRGRVRFSGGKVSLIVRDWNKLTQPAPEVYDLIETLVELVSQAAGGERASADIQVVNRRTPDLRGGFIAITIGERAVTLHYLSSEKFSSQVTLEDAVLIPNH